VTLSDLRRWPDIARKVKEVVKRVDPNARVYVFGSVVRGDFTATSDIDILVVTNDLRKKYEVMVEVYREVDAPVELHVVTEDLMKRWYLRFIRKEEIVEV